jgi:hypothetical protein
MTTRFAELLDAFLETRFHPSTRRPWTSLDFAHALDVDEPRKVQYWRNGESRPNDVEPIIRALGSSITSEEAEDLRQAHLGSRRPRRARRASADVTVFSLDDLRTASSRSVYISAFDIENAGEVRAHVSRPEAYFSERLFTYGAMADCTSFQYSAPIKSLQLHRSIGRFAEGFRRDENFELRPLFEVRSSADTYSYVDYHKKRRSLLKGDKNNPEYLAYEEARAGETARLQDRHELPVGLRKSDVAQGIVACIGRAVAAADVPKALERVMADRLSDSSKFQTYSFRDAIEKAGGRGHASVVEILDYKIRRFYHASNAMACGSALDTEPEWQFSILSAFLRAVAPQQWLSLEAANDPSVELSSMLFDLRANGGFVRLRAGYFRLQTAEDRLRYVRLVGEISQKVNDNGRTVSIEALCTRVNEALAARAHQFRLPLAS